MNNAEGQAYTWDANGNLLSDGMSTYYYDKLDKLFPGVKNRYVNQFGGKTFAKANQAKKLNQQVEELCFKYKITPRIPAYEPVEVAKETQPKPL